jgi:hypothetical protein
VYFAGGCIFSKLVFGFFGTSLTLNFTCCYEANHTTDVTLTSHEKMFRYILLNIHHIKQRFKMNIIDLTEVSTFHHILIFVDETI